MLGIHRHEKLDQGLTRVARETVERAAAHLADSTVDTATRMHEIRKRFKEIRAILRLGRFGLHGQLGELNAAFRDAARADARSTRCRGRAAGKRAPGDPVSDHRARGGWNGVVRVRAAPHVSQRPPRRTRRVAPRSLRLLGDHHDLWLLYEQRRHFGKVTAKRIGAIAERRLAEIEAAAFGKGSFAYAESPRAWSESIIAYWRAWHG